MLFLCSTKIYFNIYDCKLFAIVFLNFKKNLKIEALYRLTLSIHNNATGIAALVGNELYDIYAIVLNRYDLAVVAHCACGA